MFSSRFTWSMTANRLSAALEARRAAGFCIHDLTESNPTRAGFDYPQKEILAALSNPKSVLYEPDPRGVLSTRQVIADYYAARGERVSAGMMHLTSSTSEAYAFLFKLLADPGDEVLVPQPSYPLFDFLAALEAVHVARYPLKYDDTHGWQINLEALANTITTKTKAIVIVNPNNPTGSFLKKNELLQLNAVCAEHDLALIVDEVFSDYASGDDAHRVRSMISNRETLTFVLSGLSKICGLPQMKLAWIHVSGPERLVAESSERLEVIADTYLSVSTPIQHAAADLFGLGREIQKQIITRVTKNLETLRAQCGEGRPCRALHAEGGWYAILELPGKFSEEEFCLTLLNEDGVFVHPGYFFDFARQGFVVLSLLTPSDIFKQGVLKIIRRAESMLRENATQPSDRAS